MPRIDPAVERLLSALVTALRANDVQFCVVGALVHELLLDAQPPSRTNDADVVVMVADLEAFNAVKAGLGLNGFRPGRNAHRLEHDRGLVDILPYSRELVPNGILQLEPGRRLNMAGFEHVAQAAIDVTLDSGLVVPVIPLPLHALLKLVAYSDRHMQKDVESVEHLLRHYREEDDRRWGLEHNGELVDVDDSRPYLLGRDGRTFLSDAMNQVLRPLLATLIEEGDEDGDWRPSRGQLLRWYRTGLGI